MNAQMLSKCLCQTRRGQHALDVRRRHTVNPVANRSLGNCHRSGRRRLRASRLGHCPAQRSGDFPPGFRKPSGELGAWVCVTTGHDQPATGTRRFSLAAETAFETCFAVGPGPTPSNRKSLVAPRTVARPETTAAPTRLCRTPDSISAGYVSETPAKCPSSLAERSPASSRVAFSRSPNPLIEHERSREYEGSQARINRTGVAYTRLHLRSSS